MQDTSGIRAVIREYASEQRIGAIKQALWKVLRKPKASASTAAKPPTWRDKIRGNDDEDEDGDDDLAGFQIPKSQWKQPPMSALLDSVSTPPAPSRVPANIAAASSFRRNSATKPDSGGGASASRRNSTLGARRGSHTAR